MLQKLVKRDHVKAIIEMAKKRRRRRPNKTKHRGWEGGCQIRQRERKTTSTTITTTTSPCDSSPSLSLPLSLFLFLFVNSFLFFFLLFWCPSLSLLSLSLYLSTFRSLRFSFNLWFRQNYDNGIWTLFCWQRHNYWDGCLDLSVRPLFLPSRYR